MKRVIIESPYAGRERKNKTYARAAMTDCLERGEAPFASHLFYTQILDDSNPAQRKLGIEAGFAWGSVADLVVVYHDLGISPGMQEGIAKAQERQIPIEYRSLTLVKRGGSYGTAQYKSDFNS